MIIGTSCTANRYIWVKPMNCNKCRNEGQLRKVIRYTVIFFMLVFLVLSFLSNRIPKHYIFQNPIDQIESIELLYNQNDGGEGINTSNICSIRMLDQNEVQPFMKAIYRLETRIAYPPPSGWGCYIAKISYCNGDVEILGSYNIEYISVGHSPTGIGTYFFTGKAFEELFAKYIDVTEYPYIGVT